MKDKIEKALNWRYATKIFDPEKKVSEEDLKTILESGRLAPSSFGVEPWKFIVINNPEIRKKLREVGFDQPKITDASHLVIIAVRTDVKENIARELIERTAKAQGKTPEDLKGLADMVSGAINSRTDEGAEDWARRQTYIPLGMMMETAALMDIDTGPMEGFQGDRVDEILGLKEKNLSSSTMLAIGYRGDDEYAKNPKVRREFDEVIEFVD